jgi:hypothetical protein
MGMVAMRVIVIVARRLVHVAVVVRARVGVAVGVAVLVAVGVRVRMGMDEIAVTMLVAVHMGMRMGVAMLVGVLVRLRMVVPVRMTPLAARCARPVLVAHRPLPAQRGSPAPITLRATASPASTVILT